jgi:thioredoxin:protein disulfide reductase
MQTTFAPPAEHHTPAPVRFFLAQLARQCLLALLLCLSGLAAWAQGDFLPPERAFRVNATLETGGQVSLSWTAAPSTYLYKEKFAVTALPASIGVKPLALPDGDRHFDEAFGKEVESLRGRISSPVAFTGPLPASQAAWLKVVYQGCADAGLCYPPQTRFFKLTVDGAGVVQAVSPSADPDDSNAVAPVDASLQAPVADDSGNLVERALASGNLLHIALVCFGAGVLLSLTPCVLPMIPILSSIIVGQGQGVGRARGFALALSYSQGMALVYTLLGVAAGMMGQGLAAYLQHPWVVLGFATLMVLLALSMFGLYELQLPARVQSWLSQGAQHMPGGKLVSVFMMGAVSALVVSPCVSAPLAGALLYIGQSGNVWLGATALYAMAWGMSVPLLLVGLSMGGLLPKAGRWMVAVKALCGLLILGLALWMVRPVWPFLKAQVTGQAVTTSSHTSVLPFQRVKTAAELDVALAQAKQNGQVVMLDFYADWCVACIEMEQTTFNDAGIQARLEKALLLQVDVTANTADDRALLQRFRLFGPPAILFFSPGEAATTDGQPNIRVIGYQAADKFQQALQAAGL